VEEEKEEDAKTQRIILYVCVYIYICALNLKFTASKGRLNAEQKREFRIRIKESQRGVFVCLFSLVSELLFGQKFEKN